MLLATLLVLPSLRYGLAADDHFQKIGLTHDSEWQLLSEPWYRLFTFYDGDPARTFRGGAVTSGAWPNAVVRLPRR